MLPVVVWLIVRATCWELAFLLRAFAGFCLIANGAYLASAAVMPVGDAEELVRLGTPLWGMVPLGAAGVAGGLALWNGIGPKCGVGDEPASRPAIVAASTALAVLVVSMLVWSWLAEA